MEKKGSFAKANERTKYFVSSSLGLVEQSALCRVTERTLDIDECILNEPLACRKLEKVKSFKNYAIELALASFGRR